MVDDFGDPGNVFIENGQGRVIYDEDGFSEISSTAPKINYQVPNGVPQVYQPTPNTCWAASFTMMLMQAGSFLAASAATERTISPDSHHGGARRSNLIHPPLLTSRTTVTIS